MKKTGVVIEIDKNKVLVLSPDKKYYSINKKEPMVLGQLILFDNNDLINKYKYSKIKILSSVAAIIIFLLLSYYFVLPKNEVYAYIGFDMEESFEVSIDKNFKILDVNSKNATSSTFSDSLKIVDLSLKESMNKILHQTEKSSNEFSVILITIFPNSDNQSNIETRKNKIFTYIENVSTNLNTARIETHLISKKHRHEALSNNFSMGKGFLYNKADSQNVEITVDEINSLTIYEIINKLSNDSNNKQQNKNQNINGNNTGNSNGAGNNSPNNNNNDSGNGLNSENDTGPVNGNGNNPNTTSNTAEPGKNKKQTSSPASNNNGDTGNTSTHGNGKKSSISID